MKHRQFLSTANFETRLRRAGMKALTRGEYDLRELLQRKISNKYLQPHEGIEVHVIIS